jgi:hypothetical protein
LVTFNGIISIFIKDIGSAMTLVGSSINPIVGFILPVIFYWKTIKNKSIYSFDKIQCIICTVIIIIASLLSLINYFMELF